MDKKTEFIVGMSLGGMFILSFYLLLFFPVLWIYVATPEDYKDLVKYSIATVLTILLINSARGAYQSLKVIRHHDAIIEKIEESTQNNMKIDSYVHEGVKYRLLVELALF